MPYEDLIAQYLAAQNAQGQDPTGTAPVQPSSPMSSPGAVPPAPLPDVGGNAPAANPGLNSPTDMQRWNQAILQHKTTQYPGVSPASDYTPQILNAMTATQTANDPSQTQEATKFNALIPALGTAASKMGTIGGVQSQNPELNSYFDTIQKLNQAKQAAGVQNLGLQQGTLQYLQDLKAKQDAANALAQGQMRLAGAKQGQQLDTAQKMQDIKSAAVGPDTLNRDFSKFYSTYVAQGGNTQDTKALSNLKDAINTLKAHPEIGGGIKGNLPIGRTAFDPEGTAVEEQVKDAVKNSLKSILGGDFAAREGDQIFALAYNPGLESKVNIPRVQRVLDTLTAQQQAKMDAINYYESHGKSLTGYTGKVPSQASMEDAVRNAAGSPTGSEVQNKTIGGRNFTKGADGLWHEGQ